MESASLSTAEIVLGLAAFMALCPLALLPWRGIKAPWLFWCLHAIAFYCCAAALLVHLRLGWSERLDQALWLTVAVILLLYPAVAARWRGSLALAPLLYPYLTLLALAALLISSPADAVAATGLLSSWLVVHIVFALLAYGLASLAAVAGTAVAIQELALKRRRPNALSLRLPPLADGERLQVSLLAWSELFLGAAIASGLAEQILDGAGLFRLDHKTLLSLIAFAVIGLLLWLSWQRGLRGRQAARIVLLAYLLLTLAYAGVKFVGERLVG